jgi:hypothetical protein
MEPAPLIARLEEAGVSLADISGLPRILTLPRGIARILRCEGVLRRKEKNKNSCIVWDKGPLYTAFVKAWHD